MYQRKYHPKNHTGTKTGETKTHQPNIDIRVFLKHYKPGDNIPDTLYIDSRPISFVGKTPEQRMYWLKMLSELPDVRYRERINTLSINLRNEIEQKETKQSTIAIPAELFLEQYLAGFWAYTPNHLTANQLAENKVTQKAFPFNKKDLRDIAEMVYEKYRIPNGNNRNVGSIQSFQGLQFRMLMEYSDNLPSIEAVSFFINEVLFQLAGQVHIGATEFKTTPMLVLDKNTIDQKDLLSRKANENSPDHFFYTDMGILIIDSSWLVKIYNEAQAKIQEHSLTTREQIRQKELFLPELAAEVEELDFAAMLYHKGEYIPASTKDHIPEGPPAGFYDFIDQTGYFIILQALESYKSSKNTNLTRLYGDPFFTKKKLQERVNPQDLIASAEIYLTALDKYIHRILNEKKKDLHTKGDVFSKVLSSFITNQNFETHDYTVGSTSSPIIELLEGLFPDFLRINLELFESGTSHPIPFFPEYLESIGINWKEVMKESIETNENIRTVVMPKEVYDISVAAYRAKINEGEVVPPVTLKPVEFGKAGIAFTEAESQERKETMKIEFDGIEYAIMLPKKQYKSFAELQLEAALYILGKPDSFLYHHLKGWAELQKFYFNNKINIQSTPIEWDAEGRIIIYHYTEDGTALIEALKKDDLQRKPEKNATLRSRCFGPGLACVSSSEIKINQQRHEVAKIAVEMDNIPIVFKQGLWKAYLRYAQQEINEDQTLASEFQYVLQVMQSDAGKESIMSLWNITKAFQFSGHAIDILCGLEPTLTRLICRTTVQDNFKLDGEIITSFGYRKDTDIRFIDMNNVLEAMNYIMEQQDVSNPQEKLDTIRGGLELIESQNLLETGEYSGWNGNIDNTGDEYIHFILLWLNFSDDKILKLLDLDKIPNLRTKLDGWYPSADFPFSKDLKGGFFGSDLGSNSVFNFQKFLPNSMDVLSLSEVNFD